MNFEYKNVLVTGAAGFIGFHLCEELISMGLNVIGIDNLSPYYDVSLKKDRIETIITNSNFTFLKMDLIDREMIEALFQNNNFDVVVHLAAQAGVRYSIENPHAYTDTNVGGFTNILEGCRNNDVKHLLFASSSSVYGANTKIPFSTHDGIDHPLSLYAATKKANEMMAHCYSSLYDLPCTGLRFFTVYGPWGRPDLSLFIFTKLIIEGKPIQIFNYGNMARDFTYVNDVIESIIRIMNKLPEPNPKWDGDNPDPATSYAPYKIYNIGNNNPVKLNRFVEIIEETLGLVAEKDYVGMPAGDVPVTYADVDDLVRDFGFKPETPIEVGIQRFVEWYKEYYKIGD